MERFEHPPVTVRLATYTLLGPLVSAAAARITVSRKGLDEALEGLDVDEWMRELVARGHGSPLEHMSFTFEATCSRVCSHQLVRHRIASYTQQSMRVTDAMLRKTALKLCGLTGVDCPERPARASDHGAYAAAAERAIDLLRDEKAVKRVLDALSHGFVLNPFRPRRVLVAYAKELLESLATYYRLLASGEPMEEARYVVPAAVRTRIVFTMNARELAEVFIPLRTCLRAQWEIRILAWLVRYLLVRRVPSLFAYTGPRCIHLDNLARTEPCTLADHLDGRCGPVLERCPERVPAKAIPSCLAASFTTFREYLRTYPDAARDEPIE